MPCDLLYELVCHAGWVSVLAECVSVACSMIQYCSLDESLCPGRSGDGVIHRLCHSRQCVVLNVSVWLAGWVSV